MSRSRPSLYEYFRARRPLLVLTDPQGDTPKVSLDAGIARVALLACAKDIAAFIDAFVKRPAIRADLVPSERRCDRIARGKGGSPGRAAGRSGRFVQALALSPRALARGVTRSLRIQGERGRRWCERAIASPNSSGSSSGDRPRARYRSTACARSINLPKNSIRWIRRSSQMRANDSSRIKNAGERVLIVSS